MKELDEDQEWVFIWELGDRFIDHIVDPDWKQKAVECEHRAREEKHKFCYMIPERNEGGSIVRFNVIPEILAFMQDEYEVSFEIYATDDFMLRYEDEIIALKYFRESIPSTIQ